MDTEDLTITVTAPCGHDDAFEVINDVRSWWTGDIEGDAQAVGAEFTYRHGTVHRSTQRVTELVAGKRVVWLVTDAYLDFVADPEEWTGTTIVFELTPVADGTSVTFTHIGLTAREECFDACSDAWHFYVGTSLRTRLTAIAAAAE